MSKVAVSGQKLPVIYSSVSTIPPMSKLPACDANVLYLLQLGARDPTGSGDVAKNSGKGKRLARHGVPGD